VACLPAAVSLLLLEVLFMQISGVTLALTWPRRLCLFRVLLCGSLCYRLSPFQALGKVTLHPLVRPVCCVYLQFMWEVGIPPSPVKFSSLCHSHKLPRSWLQGTRPAPAPARASPAAWLVYLQSWEGFPSPNLQCSGRPTLFPVCLICSYCLLLSFSFFPGWRSVCPGGMLRWPRLVCGSTAVAWSSPGPHLPKPSGRQRLGALLVSPVNVKWRFSAPAGGVEGSKLYLFSVIMPAKCVFGVSPRFHYRRLTFCFLHLGAILESSRPCLNKTLHKKGMAERLKEYNLTSSPSSFPASDTSGDSTMVL
jgi:hypothetical protein